VAATQPHETPYPANGRVSDIDGVFHKETIVLKHILTLSVITVIIALASVAFAYHPVKAEHQSSKSAQTMEPILPFDEKLATPM
jgi:hypothetical protein